MTGCLPPGLRHRLAESAQHSVTTGRPDRELLAYLRDSGALGAAVPVEFGGRGGGGGEINSIVEELARLNPSVAIIAFQHLAVSARIAEWGSAALRADLLPRLADGRCLAASAWSETGAGAAKRALASTGVRQPDGTWVLDGAKSFTTGASVADVYLVLVQTAVATADPDTVYGGSGQTFFLVDGADPGLEPDLGLDLTGMRGSATGFVTMRGCVVSDADRLGPEGMAPRIIAGVRESGATLGAVALGIAQAAVDLLFDRLRGQGRLTGELIRHRLVELATRVESVRAVVERAGARSSPDPGATTLHSKLFASAVAEQICLDVARMLGSEGYTTASRIDRMLADVRAVALMGPTNDLCRDLVAASWAS